MDGPDDERPLTLPRPWRAQRLTAVDNKARVIQLVDACGAPQCPYEDVCARHAPFGEFDFGPASIHAAHPCCGFIEKR